MKFENKLKLSFTFNFKLEKDKCLPYSFSFTSLIVLLYVTNSNGLKKLTNLLIIEPKRHLIVIIIVSFNKTKTQWLISVSFFPFWNEKGTVNQIELL